MKCTQCSRLMDKRVLTEQVFYERFPIFGFFLAVNHSSTVVHVCQNTKCADYGVVKWFLPKKKK